MDTGPASLLSTHWVWTSPPIQSNTTPILNPSVSSSTKPGCSQLPEVPVGHQAWPVPAFGRAVPVAPVPAAAQPGERIGGRTWRCFRLVWKKMGC